LLGGCSGIGVVGAGPSRGSQGERGRPSITLRVNQRYGEKALLTRSGVLVQSLGRGWERF
jgi:hypothetical protein